MTDELERRLRAGLDEPLPPAPAGTRDWLEHLPLDHPRVRAGRGVRPAAATAAAVVLLAVGLVAVLSMGNITGTATDPPATPTAPPPSSTPDPLGGLTVYSVSEILDGRARGEVGDEPVAVRGFWTDRGFFHSCTLPNGQPGELQIRCRDGEFGITERDEPIGTLTFDARFVRHEGPALTPFVSEALGQRLFTLPYIHGQPYPPVPIVVIGHFDDPRAADCQPEARQLCRDRLVLDEIVEFEPRAVPTPAITPSPSPFPFDDPPAAPFTKADCFGDVPYSFVGWGYMADHGLDINPGQIMFLMIVRDTETVGTRVCFAREWEQDSVTTVKIR